MRCHFNLIAQRTWLKGHGFLISLVAAWFAQFPGQKRQDESRNTCEDKGQPPGALRQCATNPKADQNTYQLPYAPPAHDPRAFSTTEIVTHQRGTGRKIACLSDAKYHTREKERGKISCQGGESGCEAPDGHADSHDVFALRSICPYSQ